MKNGTQSNNLTTHKLTMVNGSGQEFGSPDSMDDAAADYAYAIDHEAIALEAAQNVRTMLLVLTAVSAACMTASIASGTYALWLARRQGTHKVLTDVNDILKTCQSRMRQLEAEVQQLPSRTG